MLVIAHLSDPHLDGSADATERLHRVTAYLQRLERPVDVVLVTGDIADHGLPAEYAEAAEALELPQPVLVLPGNHDVSTPFRAGLGVEGGHPVHQVRDVAGARFVLLDSSVPGEDYGWFSPESLAWLDGVLRESWDGPLFVALHHPPVLMGHATLDQWGLRDADAFGAVLASNKVTAVFAGHVHAAFVGQFAGVPMLVGPGIRSATRLPWEKGGLLDLEAPPGLAVHMYDEVDGLRTVYRYLA
ncbi:metallophosphoesterase [Kribbella deserti]|uniref:Metallophosphoesterase n=1 Tax=Kribbella deserti TaxID=1926257 RepID=A0ABV6QM88_9ACTN